MKILDKYKILKYILHLNKNQHSFDNGKKNSFEVYVLHCCALQSLNVYISAFYFSSNIEIGKQAFLRVQF